MIQTEIMCSKFLRAILTAILVSQKTIPAVELDHVSRNTVVIQQPDDARNLNRKGDGAYPVVPLADVIEGALRFTEFQPALEVEGLVLTLFDVNVLGLAIVKQS